MLITMKKKFYKIRLEEVLKFVGKYEKKNSFSPTLQEIADGIGVSRPRVCQLIAILEDEGKIRKSKWKQRNLIIIK